MTLDQMKAKASQIQRDIDMIIAAADRKQISGAINWAEGYEEGRICYNPFWPHHHC